MRPLLLTFLAFSLGGTALAAPGPSLDEARTALALDFCATTVGRDPADFAGAAAAVPGLKLSEPRPLAEHVSAPAMRASFREIFRIDDEGEIGFAAFDDAPSPRTLPYAAYTPRGDICLVVSPEHEGADSALRAHLDAAESGWTAGASEEGSRLWKRPAPWGESVMLGLSADEVMILVALEQRPVATAEQIRAVSQSVLEPCVEAILAGKAPPASVFAPTFLVIEQGPGESDPGITLTSLRSQAPGPRSVLTFNTYREFVFCQLWTTDRRQPVGDVLAAVIAGIETIPGLKPQKIKTSKRAATDEKETPALRAWRVDRKGAARKAHIRVGLRDEHVVVVTIEHASGWFW